MRVWRDAFFEGLRSGTLASLFSVAILTAAGRIEHGRAAPPINAISHWIWGARALRKNSPTWRHTANGYLIHHAASIFWATLHARATGVGQGPRPIGRALAEGLCTAGVACFADYRLTPERFRPGFEHRLSRGALLLVYAAFGLGLALGSRACRSAAASGQRLTARPR